MKRSVFFFCILLCLPITAAAGKVGKVKPKHTHQVRLIDQLDEEQKKTVAQICAAVKLSKYALPGCNKRETAKILCGIAFREGSLRPGACNGIADGTFAFKPSTARLVKRNLGFSFNPKNVGQSTEATLRLMNDDLKQVKRPTAELACIGHNCGGSVMRKAAKMSPQKRFQFLKTKDRGNAATYFQKVKKAGEQLSPLINRHF